MELQYSMKQVLIRGTRVRIYSMWPNCLEKCENCRVKSIRMLSSYVASIVVETNYEIMMMHTAESIVVCSALPVHVQYYTVLLNYTCMMARFL